MRNIANLLFLALKWENQKNEVQSHKSVILSLKIENSDIILCRESGRYLNNTISIPLFSINIFIQTPTEYLNDTAISDLFT